MTAFLSLFLDALESSGLSRQGWKLSDDEHPHLVFAARREAVGPLRIWDDDEELTLEIGDKYHCHFTGDEDEAKPVGDESERRLAAARLAAKYVAQILDERIGVAVHYRDGRCIGAALIYLEDEGVSVAELKSSTVGLYGGNVRSDRFLWSGPV